jgi:hypothetical protein
MAHELNNSGDLGKTPISEEQAKRVMALYQLKLSQAEESLTLADVAETLDMTVEEAAELLRQAANDTREPTRPRQSIGRKVKRVRIERVVIGAASFVLILSAFYVRHANAASNLGADNLASVALDRTPPARPAQLRVPAIVMDHVEVPSGFSVRISALTASALYKSREGKIDPRTNKADLRRKLEGDLAFLVQNAMHNICSVAAPVIPSVPDGSSATIVVKTEAGETSFPLRISSSAFPLDRKNPSTQKLMAAIHKGLASDWDNLVPPK